MGAAAKIRAYVSLLRPFTLIAPIVGAVLFGWLGLGRVAFDVRILAGAWVMALANAASNVVNEAFDVQIDRIAKPHRPIPSGRATRDEAIFFGVLLYGATSTLAFTLDWAYGIFVQFILLFTWMYSVPPVRIRSRYILSNLAIATPRGGLGLLASYWLTAHELTPVVWVAVLVFGLYIFGGNTAKDFPDAAADAVDGVRNFVTVLGPARAWRLMHALMLAAFGVLGLAILLGLVPIVSGLAFLVLPFQVIFARGRLLFPRSIQFTRTTFGPWAVFYILYAAALALYAIGLLLF